MDSAALGAILVYYIYTPARVVKAGKSILTDKDLETILNDSDFYLSDDEEEVVLEVNDTIEASDVEEAVLEPPDADPVPDTVEDKSNDDVPLSKIRDQLLQKHNKDKKTEEKWKRGVFENREEVYLDPELQVQDDHEYWSPLNYFLEYFPDEFWENLAEQISLLDHLLTQGILGTGTIMNNRIPRDFRNKMKNDKELLSEGRGSFHEFIREDKKCTILKWMDNRSVTMASSSTGSAPQTDVRRWDKKNSKYIFVPCLNSVTSYNRSMGGVDLCDSLIYYYRICMRTKKCPVRVFWHFIDLAITNSWIEYRQGCNGDRKSSIMDLLEFKLYIGKCLALGPQTTVSQDPRPSTPDEESSRPAKKCKKSEIPPRDVRTTGNEHLPICSVNNKNSYMRCRNLGCTKKQDFSV
ncbi:unnamed protein product [Acanthoscelides obtectus]|uniref:PiggyBac transposable element-derived protein domain-containing protein n=1 Tax=Acanthoscelides obtectus TaxID=200917 RepID=A0A9P0MB45_ACAOB|nr:unnamed protein product [Acanthoscelides obtectus]CAK1642501.1 Chimeric ERCC6-PGBD3 protein [Acanthoscelides obtectus]